MDGNIQIHGSGALPDGGLYTVQATEWMPCIMVPKDAYEKMIEENRELRERVSMLEARLRLAE